MSLKKVNEQWENFVAGNPTLIASLNENQRSLIQACFYAGAVSGFANMLSHLRPHITQSAESLLAVVEVMTVVSEAKNDAIKQVASLRPAEKKDEERAN